MTSTYLSYRIYSADLAKSLQRVGAESQNVTDQKYFEANIGKVKSVDDFINNFRLFTYAMKASGLSDLGNAKALMRQVLTSNLSDPNSVANRLNDSRYKAFAKSFNFSTTGAVASSGQLQTTAQQQDMLSKMSLTATQQSSLATSLAKVTSVADFEKNTGLYAQVLNAYGINSVSKDDITHALESDLSDPKSFANRPDFGGSVTYAKFKALAEDFNFAANGSIGSQRLLQSVQNIAAAQTAYKAAVPTDRVSQAAANDESAYYASKMPSLTSVNQIVSDPRLVSFLKTAYGLDPKMTTDQLKSVLTSNLLDPKSAANTFATTPTVTSTSTTSTGTTSTGTTSTGTTSTGTTSTGTTSTGTTSTGTTATSAAPASPSKYQLIAAAFSIGTDGSAWDHSQIATAANLAAVTKAYIATIDSSDVKAVAAAQTETDYFNTKISGFNSVSGLLADSRMVSYLRTAFNMPVPIAATKTTAATSGTSVADLQNILTSSLLDPNSAANTLGASARKLAITFNFAPNGAVYDQRPIQNATNLAATTTAYAGIAGTGASAQAETAYYTSTMADVKNVNDLLGDKRLVAYISKAYNIPATSQIVLRQVFTSDLGNAKSKANTLGGVYQTLAAAFDIATDGTIAHAPEKSVQSKSGAAATHAAYLNQALETEAGDQDGDGTRLGLYFRRVAPTITSAYGILADKAMTKIVQTMLGISSSSSNADIDSQARFIASKIKIADFKDPAKLDKMVSRFAALYDLNNSSTGSTDPTVSLFTSSSS